uniref:Serine/threonine protein kinase n=1 Tax=Schlesneria paludicola TaxID=360056 RepID=A0A7C4LNZ1_9PLAN
MQRLVFISAVCVWTLTSVATANDDWPAWRGPRGDGISPGAQAPLRWSETENIVWKTAIPSVGRSSVIVVGGRVFVTTGVAADSSRRVLSLDRADGRILWNVAVFTGPEGTMHRFNTTASSTPASDGRHVFAVFNDDQGLYVFALDFEGQVVWSKRVGAYFSNHGFAASPLLYEDGVIVNGQQDGDAFVVMLNRWTGAELWRYVPAVKLRSFSTPVLTAHNGEEQLILAGSMQTVALNPRTGNVLWSADGPSEKFVATPSVGHGLVFSFGGSPNKKGMAVRLGGTGDVTATHIAWRNERSMPYVPSPLLLGDYLHVVNDQGIYTCLEPRTGKVLFSGRKFGPVYSSPIAVGDRIYQFEDSGGCTVIANEPEFRELARNELHELVQTTPAFSRGQLFIRGEKHVYCIGNGNTPR